MTLTFFHIFGALGATAFAAIVVVDRGRSYPRWATLASIITAAAGIAWGALGYAVEHRMYHTKFAYFELLALKHLSAGVVIGFVASILMARIDVRRAARKSNATRDV